MKPQQSPTVQTPASAPVYPTTSASDWSNRLLSLIVMTALIGFGIIIILYLFSRPTGGLGY